MAVWNPTMSAKDARDLFAGELDYANVTEFRESLLPVVSELERHPMKRYLVTKHGRPLAVFLSFGAFEALRKLIEPVLAEEAKKDVQQVLVEASQRMDQDYGVGVGQPARPRARRKRPLLVERAVAKRKTPETAGSG